MDYHQIFFSMVVPVEIRMVQMVSKFGPVKLFRVVQQPFMQEVVSYLCSTVGAVLHDVAGFECSRFIQKGCL